MKNYLFWHYLYRYFAAPVIFLTVISLGFLLSKKIRQTILLRVRGPQRLPSSHLNMKQPIWFHCASGEYEYARPLIHKLKALYQAPVLVTFYSPSYVSKIESDSLIDYFQALPFDFPGACQSFLNRWNPQIGLIARTDLWPELVFQCKKSDVPTYLFSARFTKKKGFLATQVLTWLHYPLSGVFVVSEKDKENGKQFIPENKIFAMGDTRYDQVFEKLSSKSPPELPSKWKINDRPLFLAGSTWPQDEKVLLPALKDLIRQEKLQVIIAPHEPTKPHLQSLRRSISDLGLHMNLWSKIDKEPLSGDSILVIDEFGLLAYLYQSADLAFVGGSFKSSVHSVMEPLACGCPLVLGPHYKNSREAIEFQKTPLSLNNEEEKKITPNKNDNPQLNLINISHNTKELKLNLTALLRAIQSNKEIKSEISTHLLNHKGASKRISDWLNTHQTMHPVAPTETQSSKNL